MCVDNIDNTTVCPVIKNSTDEVGECLKQCGNWNTTVSAADVSSCFNRTACMAAFTYINTTMIDQFVSPNATHLYDINACTCNCPDAPATGATA